MSDFLAYGFQTVLIQGIYVLVYIFLFKKETFFRWNRVYLMATFLSSLLIPFVSISSFSQHTRFVSLNEIVLTLQNNNSITEITKQQMASNNLVSVLYFIGIVLFGLLFLRKLNQINILKKKSKIRNYKGTTIYVIANSNQAFSFLNSIFIGDKNTDFETILEHELIHKARAHSLDLLFLEFVKIIFWFNPMVYVYQNKLAEIHEFEADAIAVQKDKVKYFESILKQVFQVENFTFTNNFFNQSLIKKRIVMLQKTKSKKAALVKYVLVLPVVAFSILFFSNCTNEKKINENETETSATTKKQGNTESKKATPFAVIDEIPVFPGCEGVSKAEALNCFNEQMAIHIKKHFAYPEKAAAANIQGRVAIQFVIDKEGTITDIEARGPENGALLEKECIRIVAALPKFIPGKVEGEPVNVKYGLPITFKLQ